MGECRFGVPLCFSRGSGSDPLIRTEESMKNILNRRALAALWEDCRQGWTQLARDDIAVIEGESELKWQIWTGRIRRLFRR
jgi:hypothetical protein